MASIVTLDRPQTNTPEEHKRRLDEMGLRWGATYIYRFQGQTLAYGDIEHCGRDIEHNLKVMLTTLENEGLAYIGKAYDSDFYKRTKHLSKKEWQEALAKAEEK